jgi:excisionase family DNA binding protein
MSRKKSIGSREPLQDVSAVGVQLGLSREAVWELVRAGQLPCIHIGRRVRFDPDEVAVWVDKHRTVTP